MMNKKKANSRVFDSMIECLFVQERYGDFDEHNLTEKQLVDIINQINQEISHHYTWAREYGWDLDGQLEGSQIASRRKSTTPNHIWPHYEQLIKWSKAGIKYSKELKAKREKND